jgi:hypothetical protein
MAESLISITAPKLLLIEGKDDELFTKALLRHLEAEEKEIFHPNSFQTINYEGISKLKTNLDTIKLSSNNFDTVTHIGILRDRDYTGNPFHSIQDALVANGLAKPKTLGQIEEKDGIKAAVFLFPDNKNLGMLEDLCLAAFTGDKSLACIENYLNCLKNQDIELIESALPKARMNIFIASKSIDNAIRAGDRKVWSLDFAVQKRWWREKWNHPAFNHIKDFLRRLAE